MSIALADVLRDVHLEPGRVYRCEVGELRVEVRVEMRAPDTLPAPLDESDVRLDPWTDLPTPGKVALLEAEPGWVLLPDVPRIPVD